MKYSYINIENIIFDADDTLWHDAKYFASLKGALNHYGLNHGISISRIKNHLQHILKNEKRGEQGFANAILQTATELAYKKSDLELLEADIDAFLRHPVELMNGIRSFLTNIKCQKIILTKGVFSEQMKKVNDSGIGIFFDNVIVVNKKNTEKLKVVLSLLDFDIAKSLMIGNSITHDIEPAIENCMSAIWFNHTSNLHGRNSAVPKVLEINNWSEVTPFFRHLLT
jgi:putative hydrolase of the HAD superfamily